MLEIQKQMFDTVKELIRKAIADYKDETRTD